MLRRKVHLYLLEHCVVPSSSEAAHVASTSEKTTKQQSSISAAASSKVKTTKTVKNAASKIALDDMKRPLVSQDAAKEQDDEDDEMRIGCTPKAVKMAAGSKSSKKEGKRVAEVPAASSSELSFVLCRDCNIDSSAQLFLEQFLLQHLLERRRQLPSYSTLSLIYKMSSSPLDQPSLRSRHQASTLESRLRNARSIKVLQRWMLSRSVSLFSSPPRMPSEATTCNRVRQQLVSLLPDQPLHPTLIRLSLPVPRFPTLRPLTACLAHFHPPRSLRHCLLVWLRHRHRLRSNSPRMPAPCRLCAVCHQ